MNGLDRPPLRVLAKVNLWDVLLFRKGAWSDGWKNKVDRFRGHLDFLLVTAAELRPALAIELDDASHRSGGGEKAADRDAVKDAVLAAAGLPLLRVPAKQSYRVEDVRRRIIEERGTGKPTIV